MRGFVILFISIVIVANFLQAAGNEHHGNKKHHHLKKHHEKKHHQKRDGDVGEPICQICVDYNLDGCYIYPPDSYARKRSFKNSILKRDASETTTEDWDTTTGTGNPYDSTPCCSWLCVQDGDTSTVTTQSKRGLNIVKAHRGVNKHH